MGGASSTNQHRPPPTPTTQRASTIGRTAQEQQYQVTTTAASPLPTIPKTYTAPCPSIGDTRADHPQVPHCEAQQPQFEVPTTISSSTPTSYPAPLPLPIGVLMKDPQPALVPEVAPSIPTSTDNQIAPPPPFVLSLQVLSPVPLHEVEVLPSAKTPEVYIEDLLPVHFREISIEDLAPVPNQERPEPSLVPSSEVPIDDVPPLLEVVIGDPAAIPKRTRVRTKNKKAPAPVEPEEVVLPSLSLSGDDAGVPLYVQNVFKSTVCFFVPDGMDFFAMNRSAISLKKVKENSIYLVDAINRKGQPTGKYSAASQDCRKKLTERKAFACDNEETDDYRSVVLPALLLGSRVRDFEQRCARVEQVGDLVLNMPSQKVPYLKFLKLKTLGGRIFKVAVTELLKTQTDSDKRWIVTCSQPTVPLGLRTGDLLEIMGIFQQQPRVTDALMHFGNNFEMNAAANWFLLDCIYGQPSLLSHPPVNTVNHPIIQYAGNGGLVPLNSEQKEAVARYNSSCPGFGIEAPPGSGKTLTAAAMAVSYAGDGIQLFLSTANVPVFNMALQLAKLDYGSRSPIHLMSAESEEKETEETRSPFSSLSLAKNQENLREKIEALELELKHAPNFEEKDKLRAKIRKISGVVLDQPHDIYFATVDTMLGRFFKANQGGRHNKDAVKKQLTENVKRIVVDEASQLTEAALNALIICFPEAQIVLIGDSKQLPPFRYQAGDVVSELAARPALDVIKDKANLPVIKLHRVYRASLSLISHYSEVFYEGKLKSAEMDAKNPLACFAWRGGAGSRRLFWRVNKGASITPPGTTSKINHREAVALQFIVGVLRNHAKIEVKDVMIISYYEAQRKKVELLLPGYEVLTVDSAQGREKRVVIVLTTRTSVPTDPNSFFNDAKRCNVAMSRHREGLIVLGHPDISVAPNWAQVLSDKYFKHVEDNSGYN